MEEQFKGHLVYKTHQHEVASNCPSNIALIKYWGKYDKQIPANPSISYTLSRCLTETYIVFDPDQVFDVKVYLSEVEEPEFSSKIKAYFRSIEPYLPWILSGSYVIKTLNTFPHSSGIASSASGFGALAKCLMEMDATFAGVKVDKEYQDKKASFLARLGSGSACRSMYEGLVEWGELPEMSNSSDLYAVQYPKGNVHEIFQRFNDWVLLVHEGEKSVSSTVGHGLMKSNPYAETRFQEARDNFKPLFEALKSGDLRSFVKLVEHEALTLHAMMMMSDPAFILMKCGTMEAINRIWEFRKEANLPVLFTLDAGANVHILFPDADVDLDGNPVERGVKEIKKFIENELKPLAQNNGLIKDNMQY